MKAAAAPLPSATPGERLALSRERIRRALADAAAGEPATGAATWRDELRSIPGAELLLEVFDQWWSRHPLQATARAATALLRSTIEPLVRRHPLRSLLAALALGGLLVCLRPWRWRFGTVLLAGLLQRLMAATQASGGDAAPAAPPATP